VKLINENRYNSKEFKKEITKIAVVWPPEVEQNLTF
jgi:hypothetical protein